MSGYHKCISLAIEKAGFPMGNNLIKFCGKLGIGKKKVGLPLALKVAHWVHSATFSHVGTLLDLQNFQSSNSI